ncbi:MAG: hypothetical protein JRS35_14535 [Deltaproteobacteria bacterium]|nr:hypothetical protein [Deltaproteobacteria bacterium]
MSVQSLRDLAEQLEADESGDLPVGPLLLIGLIVIPLVIFLITFGSEIQEWFSDNFEKLKGDKGKIKTGP